MLFIQDFARFMQGMLSDFMLEYDQNPVNKSPVCSIGPQV
jgi:hypothetical protein